MKKINLLIIIVAFAIIALPACKKTTDTAQSETTLKKIQVKWQLKSQSENSHYSGAGHPFNNPGTASDYFDFRADGKVYTQILGIKDTTTYSLNGDDKLVIAGSYLFDIKSLNAHEYIL